MPKFKVTYDQKTTIWVRSTLNIEADSLEEAQSKFKATVIEGMVEYEILPDTIEFMSRKENCAMAYCDNLLPSDKDWDQCALQVEEFPEELNREL